MHESIRESASFRFDINGLRAWAVIAVILYHYGVPGFTGGFVGVDVFFVISGFLMTGIVVRGLERDTFSPIAFYLARARRIVPALVALCAALLVLGWFIQMPSDYKKLGTHTTYSLAFISNIEFWQEAGYFDAASHEKWLLHTWSLSVEWQFYLALPLVLMAAWKARPGRATQAWVISLSLLVSLTLCVVLTPKQPVSAFFLLHARAWEMLCGGLVFLIDKRSMFSAGQRRGLQSIGLVLILAATFIFDKHSSWPGWRAALPVVAAMMVLSANRPTPWLCRPLFQWIGARSYSLYLWHWPMYVVLVYLEWHDRSVAILGGIGVTMVLGHLSYVLIENPSRKWLDRWTPFHGGFALFAITTLVVLPAVTIWRQQGLSGRFEPVIELAAAESGNFNPRRQDCYSMSEHPFPSCLYGGETRRVIGIGDSHLSTTMSAIAQARRQPDDGVMEWSYRGCQFVPGMKFVAASEERGNFSCDQFISRVVEELDRAPKDIPVVLIGRYAYSALGPVDYSADTGRPQVYFTEIPLNSTPEFLREFGSHITRAACELAKRRPVYMVRPFPEIGLNVPKTLSRRMALGKMDDLSISIDQYQQRNSWVWAAQNEARDRCGVKLLDPLPYLCDAGRCYGSRNGRPLYFDDNHLSEYGNKLLVPMFTEVFPPH